MFVQVIKGRVSSAAAAKDAFEGWDRDLRPGAEGFLGSTMGVADDGTFVTLARFESEETARRNSDRPEQTAWWEKTSQMFDGDPVFYESSDVDLFAGGGSDDAGFVQVMVYKPQDIAAIKEAAKTFESFMHLRPDLLGGFTVYATDGTVIDANYFTSEAEAREGEKKEMPEELQQAMSGFENNVGEVEFIDLKNPSFS